MTLFRVGVVLVAAGWTGLVWFVAWRCADLRQSCDRTADRMVCAMDGYSAGLHDGLIRGRQEAALECARRNHPSRRPFAERLEELPLGAHPEAVAN